jgi:uncharacterized protein (TIGR02118 family)
MSGVQVLVAYPRKESSSFNKEYYLSTHMPLAAKYWKKHGFKSYSVSECNEDGPYMIISVMVFETKEGWGAAIEDPNTKEVMEDIPNFTSEHPVLIHGGVIGQSTV